VLSQYELGPKDTMDDDSMTVGDIFLRYADYFKIYTQYCANRGNVMNTFKKMEASVEYYIFETKFYTFK
jgi:hypothetical protein